MSRMSLARAVYLVDNQLAVACQDKVMAQAWNTIQDNIKDVNKVVPPEGISNSKSEYFIKRARRSVVRQKK